MPGAGTAILVCQSKSRFDGDISGNLGFTYGTESDAKSSEAYLRVWLWYQSRWCLLFDVATNMK
jgi:hypothetical protein